MTLGFIVGKFYPPHRGHKHLIDTARRQVDRLIVMIAHHPSQTIPGEVRKAWLEEIHPDCEIHLVPDELENDSRQWAEFTVRYLGRRQTLCSLARTMGRNTPGSWAPYMSWSTSATVRARVRHAHPLGSVGVP